MAAGGEAGAEGAEQLKERESVLTGSAAVEQEVNAAVNENEQVAAVRQKHESRSRAHRFLSDSH